MKLIIHLISGIFFIFFANNIFALDEPAKPFTVESTKGAKINFYCYENAANDIKERPILLVHGFNSSGEVWSDKNKNYVKKLTERGYDVIVVDMRGNAVDTNGDHKIDAPMIGNSWGYGVRDLGDDVGVALKEGIDYLNKNLPDRNYKKADVITHSTGGLAVTAYSRSLGLVPYRDNIETIIELAPPNNGSTSLVANIKNILGVIPSVFAQSMTACQYALEVADNKIWIPGSRMESEALRKELSPDSMFLKSIQDLGPDKRIKTFIAIGSEDLIVGDWSPVIEKREDIGYEYFLGVNHFNFCNSETVLAVMLDKLEKGGESIFFKRLKPYKNKQLAFLSGPGIDHPDDTFDTVDFAKGIDMSPRKLFDLYLRIAVRKNKAYLMKYWEILTLFEDAQLEISTGANVDNIINEWEEALGQKNKLLHDYYIYASREYLESPDIAVLANGYYNEMRKLIIEKVGEPVRIIDHTFEPYILDEQKVLVIPTGGLSGLSHSAIFKNKLSEYVKNGGAIICFSQQYGYDFNALPGERLNAYGWQEDASCHTKAAYIENFHQVLSSQNELYPDIKLDGYFTDYPDGAAILLRRSKNQMPAMLLYNFGKGVVIVASMYSDWGYLNGQASSSEINLVRDLLRWAKSGKNLPEYKTGESFEIPIQTNLDFNKIEMILKSPEGEVLERNISNEAAYKLGQALEKPGIYSVDYILYDIDSKAIQPQAEGIYFSFAKPPPDASQNPDFTFDITSDSENYISGNVATFTFHMRNNTARDESIKYKAILPHHKIEYNDIVVVPAGKTISFDKEIIASSTDLLSSYFYSSQNVFIGKAERGINVFEPSLDIDMSSDKEQYLPGEIASINVNFKNKTSVSLNILTILDITDSSNKQIYYCSSEIKLAELGSGSWPQSFAIPEDISRGTCKAKLSTFSNSRLIGFKSICFEGPKPLSDGEDTEIATESYSIPGLNVDLIVNMENNYPKNQLISASVKIKNIGEIIEKGYLDIRVFPELNSWDLYGTVRDDNGAVIKGAIIEGIYTNKDGKYRLKGLDKGHRVISIKAPAFDTVSKDIEIFPGDNNLDINLTPSKYGNLSGVIENSIGSTITLEPVNVASSNTSTRFAVTSGDSLFKFIYVPVGNYLLTASPGNISKNIQINEGENIFNDTLDPAIYQDSEEIEPNSAFTNANEIDVDSRIHGKIYSTGDEDFFKFNIQEKGVLYIKMYEVPQGLRPSIKIYDTSGKVISMKGGSANENVILETEFDKPGLYYLLVRDWYGNVSSLNSYSLNFNFIKTLDEYEPNETKEAARLIDFGKNYFATVATKADSDFYKLSIPDAGKITVYLKDMPVNVRPYMKLYKESGQNIDIKGGASGEDVTMEFETANPSNYYIQVYDRYNSESSFLRYKLLAVYTSGDEYSGSDFACFQKREEISNIENESVINFEIPAIAGKGKYYIEATLKSPIFQETVKFVKAFYIGEKISAPIFKVFYLEDEGLSFNAGEKAKFRFRIINEGEAQGKCEVNFKSQDLINETRSELLGSGKDKEIAFEFLIPEDADEGNYEAEYKFKDETHKVNFKIIGVKVEAEAEAEAGIFKLNVKNLSSAKGLKLFAEARCSDYEKKIDFVLNEEKDLEFNIPGLNDNEKIYYGIYFESGKSLYLNSYLINGEKPETSSIKIIKAGCDKDIYEDGENVALNWKIESGEACSIKLSAYLIKPDSDAVNIIEEDVNLQKGVNKFEKIVSPELDRHGIYRVMYKFGEIGQGSIFFDVGEKEIPKKNHEPVLFTIGEKEIIAGDSLEFFVEAVDIDGDLLIYSAETLPRGASFDPWVKRFFWKPVENQTGEYFVTFIVSDGKVKASEKVKIIVSDSLPIILEAKSLAEPLNGMAPLEVHFKSEAISKFKRIVKYEWDFDGKGIYDFSSPESGEVVFIYTGEGSFPAKLRVTDKNGITNTYTVTINVAKNPDAPGVYLNAFPLEGVAPCKVFFKGDAFCPQGVSKYEWDFDGDGVFEANSSESGEVVKTYALPGKYNAEFRVTSFDGLTGSEKALIEIEDPKVLSVSSSVSPVTGNVPLEINFEAAVNSSNLIQKYQWDFEGDGVFDYTSLSPGIIKHTYCEPGVYTPTVRVTDSNNLSNQAKSEIRFGIFDPEDIKKGKIIINPQKGNAPLAVRFSFEIEDEISDVEYLWDFDNDGIIDLVTLVPQAEFTYNDSGTYMTNLDVRTIGRVIMSCQETIYVSNGKNNDKKPIVSPNNVYKYKIGRIELSDKTSLVMPADILEQDDIVNIKRLESSQIQREININQNKPIGEYREYQFENHKGPFNKEMIISIPYIDENGDGIVDDKNIDELTLEVYWYDEKNVEWKILSGSFVFPKENIVTVKTSHFTIFGIAGAEKNNENVAQPENPGQQDSSGGGGGSCFIATAAFGSTDAKEVVALREFRDQCLLKSKLGKEFVNLYYRFSPPIAELIKDKPLVKLFIRVSLKFLIAFLRAIV
nr:alpha/beta fold hydrolase [Candidatus Omnitrophota bacterium]